MAFKTITRNYTVVQNAAVVLHAGKSDEANIRGLTGIALPTGFEKSNITVSEMGRRIDLLVGTGGTYTPIDIPINFLLGDPTQTELRDAALNDTAITDMRFYLKQGCDFVALDLINDSGGSYGIGSVANPSAASKNDLVSSSMTILPAGSSVEFIAHTASGLGTNITFASESTTTAGATAVLSAGTWAGFGFEEDDVVIIDYLDGNDPLYAKIETISTVTATFYEDTGDSATIPDATGISATQVHGATGIEIAGYSSTCD